MGKSPEMSNPEGKFVSANGLEIFYREWGTGRPLLLLHGGIDTHRFWKHFILELSRKYRVITPDNRGHGRTITPELALSVPIMADDLAGFLQEMELDSPFIFGFSDGGQTALDLGIRYPDLAGALVLGGVWYMFSQDYQAGISNSGFVSPGVMDFDVYERSAPRDWQERLKRAHHDPRPDYPRILLSALAKLWWTPLDYSDEDFEKIQAPVLILAGEKDEFIPPDEARDLSNKIPGSELAIIPGAGHEGLIHQGIDQVRNFLDSHNS